MENEARAARQVRKEIAARKAIAALAESEVPEARAARQVRKGAKATKEREARAARTEKMDAELSNISFAKPLFPLRKTTKPR